MATFLVHPAYPFSTSPPPSSSSTLSGSGSSKSTKASSAAGAPFCPANLHVNEWYIRVGQSLFPLEHFDDKEVPAKAEQIHLLSKQMGSVVLERDSSYITKFGSEIRQTEEQAMRLVSEHTSIPIPKVTYSDIDNDSGQIGMTIIPGTPLNQSWPSLDDDTKMRFCRETWSLLAQLQNIPRPSECEGLK